MKFKSAFLATTAILAAGNVMAVEANVYGQVNKLIGYVDNGDSETSIVDNSTSSTRFGIKAQQQLDSGLIVSGLLEFASESDASEDYSFSEDTNLEDYTFEERHARIGLASKFGTFLIGHTSEVNDGITEMDLAGVQDVMSSNLNAIGGAIDILNKDKSSTGVTPNDLYDNIDGIRTNLVRYDTPLYYGASAGFSATSGGDMAVALKYDGYLADSLKVKAGAAYKKFNSSDNTESTEYGTGTKTPDYDYSGSVSAKHETSGIAGTFAIGSREFKGVGESSASFWYGKLSYAPVTTNFEFGIDFGRGGHAAANTGNMKAYGIGAQYNIAEGVSTSLMYRHTDISKSVTETAEDIDMITGGLRVKF